MSDSNDELGQLALRVAHALRTPIGVVGGVLDQLKEVAGAPAIDRTRLQELGERSLAQIARIADRLSLLGEIERGLEPGRQAHAVRAMIEAAVDTVARTRRRRGVEVTFADAGGDMQLVCDPALMRAALAEIIDNAVRFARARVKVELDAAEATIDIANDGPKVEPATVSSLAGGRPASADRAGLGIGLWIAARILSAHGGSVEHCPQADGARFRVLLRRSV